MTEPAPTTSPATDRPEKGVRVAVLGSGAWGTTFAAVMADAGCDVTLWARREDVVADVRENHRNEAYLAGVELPVGVTATTDAAEAVRGAQIVAVAVPSQHARTGLAPFAALLEPDAVVVGLDGELAHIVALPVLAHARLRITNSPANMPAKPAASETAT